MRYIGIDPGLGGGIALLDSDGLIEYHSPLQLKNGQIDCHWLCSVINHFKKYGELLCVLEKVGAMPKQNVNSIFTFGEVLGRIKSCLELNKIPFQEVTPQTWKKAILVGLPWKVTIKKIKKQELEGLSDEEASELQKKRKSDIYKAKKQSKVVACEFIVKKYPTIDIKYGKKHDHDGVAEAICMALYAKNHC